MTVLVEKYLELPFEYSSDEEALEHLSTLMQLTGWQAICDVTQKNPRGAEVDCPDGLAELYFEAEMQVVLFKVSKLVTGSQPTGDFDDEGATVYAEVDEMRTTLRAASFLPERDDDA